MTENRQYRLLLVEDNLDVQGLAKEFFESEGYEVYCASNGKEALDFLRGGPARTDLILLDLMMPVMDGYQFRKEQLLDASIASIPVVILSADGNAQIRIEHLGRCDFCTKSSGIDKMLEAVKRNLN